MQLFKLIFVIYHFLLAWALFFYWVLTLDFTSIFLFYLTFTLSFIYKKSNQPLSDDFDDALSEDFDDALSLSSALAATFVLAAAFV